MRRYRRTLLLVVLPIVAVIAGVVFYLSGGRYVTTDDAYVGAQKVLITPDISGKIEKSWFAKEAARHKGRRIVRDRPGAVPARGRPGQGDARTGQDHHNNLGANLKIYDQMVNLMQQSIDLKQKRRRPQVDAGQESFGSQLDLDNPPPRWSPRGPGGNRPAADLQREDPAARRRRFAAGEISGLITRPRQRWPRPSATSITTVMRAPMSGIATQVDQIQLGRFVMAGAPVFSVIDIAEALGRRQSEGIGFHHVAVGQTVDIDVDAFPDHAFKGTIGSLSPAPARNSQSCRRRTPPAISSRWCSACRCGSISTATTNSSRS